MAKLKLKKFPKKPKQSASLATMENYLLKVRTIEKENASIKSQNSKMETLKKKIAAMKPGIGRVSSAPKKRKKSTTTTKKKKTATRKKRR